MPQPSSHTCSRAWLPWRSSSTRMCPGLLPSACQALVPRFMITWLICDASALTSSGSFGARWVMRRLGGSVARSSWTVSSTTGCSAWQVNTAGWRRLNDRMRCTMSRARSPALVISSMQACTAAGSPWRSRASAALPRMAATMLLKSCAMPPAMVPSASIFCDSRSCVSSALRSLSAAARADMSRRISRYMGRPVTWICEIDASTGKAAPSLRSAVMARARRAWGAGAPGWAGPAAARACAHSGRKRTSGDDSASVRRQPNIDAAKSLNTAMLW